MSLYEVPEMGPSSDQPWAIVFFERDPLLPSH